MPTRPRRNRIRKPRLRLRLRSLIRPLPLSLSRRIRRRTKPLRERQRLLPIPLLLLHQRALDTSQILGCKIDEPLVLGRVLERFQHLADLGFGADVRTCAAVAEVREAAEPAVLDAGDFEGAGALGVLLAAGVAEDFGVVCVGGFEGGADGHADAGEGFYWGWHVSFVVACQIDDL